MTTNPMPTGRTPVDPDSDPGTDAGSGGRPSQATELVSLAGESYTVHASVDGEPLALPIDGPRVARTLRGSRASLRAELAAAYWDRHRRAASASGLADALAVIEGLALRAEPPVPVYLRNAEHDGAVWLDLGRPDGRSVRITPARWEVTDNSGAQAPVWRRSEVTGQLPEPARGGDLGELWGLLNVGDAHRPLVTAWLVAALIPSIPAPILGVTGEQGTGKSSATRALVSLVDPSPAPLRTAPRDLADWIVAAAGSRVVGLDNVSGMPAWLSDALCRAVTGEGLVRRALFTDDGLSVLFFRRVIVCNGIDLGIGRGDLADRMIVAELNRITDQHRRLDADVAHQWDDAHPRVLGALCDLTAAVLAELPAIELDTYPRMADYARVLAAVDQLTGTNGLAAYLGQRDQLAADLIAGDPLAAAIRAHIDAIPFGDWTGTAAELLTAVDRHRPIGGGRTWPTSPRAMSTALTRLAPALRAVGVRVELGQREARTGRRLITLAPQPEGAGNDRHLRHHRHPDPLTSTNRGDAKLGRGDGGDAKPGPGDANPRPGDANAWPTVTPPGAADQRQHPAGDAGDEGDAQIPAPPVRTPTRHTVCIACRQPMTYDDGTHTHPTCHGGAA
jgi:hypothetical protein